MLYINSELLDTSNRTPEYKFKDQVKEYHDTLNYLKETYSDHIKLYSKRRPERDPKTGVLRTIATGSIPLEVNFQNGSQTEEWIYTDKLLPMEHGKAVTKKKGENLFERTLKIRNGEINISLLKQPELAFYAYKKSGKVGEGSESGAKFYINNIKKMARTEAEANARDAKLLNSIYNVLDEKKVRILAKSYGVMGVDNLTLPEVKNQLLQRVKDNEAIVRKGQDERARGIDAFFRDTDINKKTQIGSLIQDAIDKGVVVYDIAYRRWEINYNDGRGNFPLIELDVKDSHVPKEVLLDFLTDNDDSLHRVQKAMGTAGLMSIGVEMDAILQENNPQKLKSIAREHCSFKFEKKSTALELKWSIIAELWSKQVADENVPEYLESLET